MKINHLWTPAPVAPYGEMTCMPMRRQRLTEGRSLCIQEQYQLELRRKTCTVK